MLLARPLVAMYGPTDQTRTRLLARTSKIISTENESFCACYGFKAGEDELLHKYGPNFCMQDITPSKVLSVITKGSELKISEFYSSKYLVILSRDENLKSLSRVLITRPTSLSLQLDCNFCF